MRINNQGFTIIEIIFAFALLAVGLAEVVIIMGEGQSHSKLAKMNTIALGLAKGQMESIKNLPYAGVIAVPVTAYAAPYLDYSYQIFVTSIGGLPGQIKDVVVRVSYNASKGITNSINLETYVANY